MTRQRLLRWLVVVLLLAAGTGAWIALSGRPLVPAALGRTLASLGNWAPLVFVLLYAAGTLALLPAMLFALTAGALFGPAWGTLLNLAGATLGATGAFLLARHLVSGWVRHRTGPRLEHFIGGVEAEGWRFVAFVRLVPLFPFNLTNYALGLTRIPLLHYVVTSLICMAPGAVAYTWLGHAGRSALAGDASAVRYGLAALGLLAAIAFLPRLVQRLHGQGPRWIDVDRCATELTERRPAVIDVRGPDEFAGPLGHIAQAVNLPLGELPERLSEIMALRDGPLILVCRTDKRSAEAAALLREAGFRDVRVLRGGMEAWNRTGRPVAREALQDQPAALGETP